MCICVCVSVIWLCRYLMYPCKQCRQHIPVTLPALFQQFFYLSLLRLYCHPSWQIANVWRHTLNMVFKIINCFESLPPCPKDQLQILEVYPLPPHLKNTAPGPQAWYTQFKGCSHDESHSFLSEIFQMCQTSNPRIPSQHGGFWELQSILKLLASLERPMKLTWSIFLEMFSMLDLE